MIIETSPVLIIYGNADPNSSLAVRIEDYVKIIKSDDGGQWRVEFPEILYKTPFSIVIQGKDTTITLNNVLSGKLYAVIGDAYSGILDNQDSILCTLRKQDHQPRVRIFRFTTSNLKSTKRNILPGKWLPADVAMQISKTCATLRALIEIIGESNIPIGLIDMTWPATSLDSWIESARNNFDSCCTENIHTDSVFMQNIQTLRSILIMKDTCRNGIEQGALKLWYNDINWKTTDLPVIFTNEKSTGDFGFIYLRRKLYFPEKYLPNRFEIGIGHINGEAEFYFNENKVESFMDESGLRKIIIADSIVKPFTNILAIRFIKKTNIAGIYGNNFYCISADTSYNIKIDKGWKYKSDFEEEFPEYYFVEKEPSYAYEYILKPLNNIPVNKIFWYGSSKMTDDTTNIRNKLIEIFKSIRNADQMIVVSNKPVPSDTLFYGKSINRYNTVLKEVTDSLNIIYYQSE